MYNPIQERIKAVEDLVLYYRGDDTTGDSINKAPDTSGSFNGSVSGVTRGVNGYIGKAYSFDGENDFIDIGNIATSDAIKAGLPQSFFFLMRVDGLPPVHQPIILTGDWNSTKYTGVGIQYQTAGNLSVEVGNGGGAGSGNRKSYVTTDGAMLANRWLKVGIILADINTCTIRVNGANRTLGSSGTGGSIAYDSNTSKIGKASNTTRVGFFEGQLQHIGIVNRAMSTDELDDIFSEMPPIPAFHRQ